MMLLLFGNCTRWFLRFICLFSALRTPVTRARRGGLKDVHAEMMLATVLKGVLSKTGIDPKLIEDLVVGNVLPPGGGATVARMAALYAGIPESSSVMTVNRQCSSGLQAVAQVASAIKSGYIDIGIGKEQSGHKCVVLTVCMHVCRCWS